jgi:phosphoribosylanthranilate isomerase
VTRIKVCGLTRREDAELAAELGASALGFVFEPASPRCLDAEAAGLSWIASLPPYVARVAVYGVSRLHSQAHLFDHVQAVHWEQTPEPWQKAIHAMRIKEGTACSAVENLPEAAVALVLDAFSDKEYGGTGRQIDWGLARSVVEQSQIPVILAGGLNAENVGRAIREVKPYAVDVSSGVESAPGIKDAQLLRAFINNVLEAAN